MSDHYKILSVEPTASQAQIRNAVEKMATAWSTRTRPEGVSPKKHSEILSQIRRASAVLTDPAQRLEYDLSRGYRKNSALQTDSKRKTNLIPLKYSQSIEALEIVKIPGQLDYDKLEKSIDAINTLEPITLPLDVPLRSDSDSEFDYLKARYSYDAKTKSMPKSSFVEDSTKTDSDSSPVSKDSSLKSRSLGASGFLDYSKKDSSTGPEIAFESEPFSVSKGVQSDDPLISGFLEEGGVMLNKELNKIPLTKPVVEKELTEKRQRSIDEPIYLIEEKDGKFSSWHKETEGKLEIKDNFMDSEGDHIAETETTGQNSKSSENQGYASEKQKSEEGLENIDVVKDFSLSLDSVELKEEPIKSYENQLLKKHSFTLSITKDKSRSDEEVEQFLLKRQHSKSSEVALEKMPPKKTDSVPKVIEIKHVDSFQLLRNKFPRRMTDPVLPTVSFDRDVRKYKKYSVPLHLEGKPYSMRYQDAAKLLEEVAVVLQDHPALSEDTAKDDKEDYVPYAEADEEEDADKDDKEDYVPDAKAEEEDYVPDEEKTAVRYSDIKQVIMPEDEPLSGPPISEQTGLKILDEVQTLYNDFRQSVYEADTESLYDKTDADIFSEGNGSTTTEERTSFEKTPPEPHKADTDAFSKDSEEKKNGSTAAEDHLSLDKTSSKPYGTDKIRTEKKLSKAEKKLIVKDWRYPATKPLPMSAEEEEVIELCSQSVSATTRIAEVDVKTVYHFGPDEKEFIEVFMDNRLLAKIVKDEKQDVYTNAMKHDDLPLGIDICASTVIIANGCRIITEVIRRGKRQSIAVYKDGVLLCRSGNTVLEGQNKI